MDPLTRVSLIQRVKNPADRDAWGEFWQMYEPLLQRYMRRLHVKEHDAGDLVNDLFLKLRDLLPAFSYDRSRGQFRGWLRRICDNHVRDFFRSSQRHENLKDNAAQYLAAVQKSLDDTPEAERIREQTWQRNRDALAIERAKAEFAHRATTWACFEKCMLSGRSGKDVAAELGIDKVNTVYVYCKRVLDRVRELRDQYDQETDLATEASDAHNLPG